MTNKKKIKITVLGMGYVGLPLAYEFGKHFHTIGYDISKEKIINLKKNLNFGKVLSVKNKKNIKKLKLTYNKKDLMGSDYFILCLPTPINYKKKPDLNILLAGIKLTQKYLKKGSTVIIESTVYPGTTEEICLPILKRNKKLKYKKDFNIGYSPERINPGDKKNYLTNIDKIVSGDSAKTSIAIKNLYSKIIKKVHIASSIKTAETAKIIENTQRDINIALINEVTLICKKMNIDIYDVLKMANTKWNFLNFTPGLVGGHCIGVDPYYLAYKSKQIGHNPKVIMAGREINDKMPSVFTQDIINNLRKIPKKDEYSVLVFGLAFKKNCTNTRNSKIFEVIKSLQKKNINIDYYDDILVDEEIKKLNKSIKRVISLASLKKKYNVIIMNSSHDHFKKINNKIFTKITYKNSFIYDLGNFFSAEQKKIIKRKFLLI